MAYNFHANQFERAFKARSLSNWEVPKWYPPRPRHRKGSTQVIADDRGHLLPNIPKAAGTSPWGNYKTAWQLPDKLTRAEAERFNEPLVGHNRWAKLTRQKSGDRPKKQAAKPKSAFREVRDENLPQFDAQQPVVPDLEYIPGDLTQPAEQHPSRVRLLDEKRNRDLGIEPEPQLNDLYLEKHVCEELPFDMRLATTRKPNERSPSPLIPAYCNFQLARQMHQENLEHQPLPDCVADQAYRKMQAQGSDFPGLSLDMDPLATGVGVKTYKAGPTHCTKMKVYRPQTCGVVPPGKKMGSMDLAIRWDYRPSDPSEEPKRPIHIDGSNDSAGPAIFTVVRTPRSPQRMETGRSGGVFTNTFGELGFFDKDVMRKNTPFAQKCSCGTSPIQFARSKSVSRDSTASTAKRKRCQSSPNLSAAEPQKVHKPGFLRKTARMCYKVAPTPYPPAEDKPQFKSAFKAGTSSDGGYSSMSAGSASTTTKVLVIPRQRDPYAKKKYNIDTLVPPFLCVKGGAGQGGYPEHWRLASVYQHAYKPIEQRRKPLLQTVYK